MASITLADPAATQAHGRALGELLPPGTIIALCGELGAGKTHFTKGLAEGLGSEPAEVTSPTFTLIHEYTGGRLPLFHFDFYRLESEKEALRLGLDEYLGQGVVVIEWADKFPRLLPKETRWFVLTHGAGTERVLEEIAGPA